jgi:hypothetical protein
MPAYLARTGLAVFAMLFGITLLTEHVAAGRGLVAGPAAFDLPPLREIVRTPIDDVAVARVAAAGFESAAATPASVPEPALLVAAPASPDAFVLASWYGPGFYGNRTACGQTYTPELLGVAHLTLPCGTPLTLTYDSRSVRVTVIDRGPYVAGRAIDLSNATKLALGCTDLCPIRMQIAR